jgi:tetratricopeptide (TPR) repeat protein
MKKTIAVVGILAAVVVAAALAVQIAARQRDYRAFLMRGDDALRNDETFDAIEAYSGAIALRPDSMLAYLRRGESYRRRGELEAAARDLLKASTLDRSAPRPLEELGDVMYQLQRHDRAIDAYQTASRLDDRTARLAYKLALARYRYQDVDGALTALEQTIRLDERMADAYYLQGMCLREKGRTADSLKSLERAVALSPALVPAREELADIFSTLDRRADQIEQLQLLASLDRDHVARTVAIALAHARSRRWDTAVVTLTGALERAPNDPLLYRALGQVWLESAIARNDRVDLVKAREALDRVASSPAATSEMLMLAGRAALEDGDLAKAERAFEDASARFPVEPPALLYLASTAERQNHLDAARRALIRYEALVADDSDFAGHAARIAALSLRLNDAETAGEWTRRGLDKDPQNAQLVAISKRLSAPASDPPDRASRPRGN